MEYINHITLNSGHTRKSYPSEVSKELYFILQRIYKDIFSGGAELFDGYTIKGTWEDGVGVIYTVFDPQGNPVVTSGVSKYRRSELWTALHTSSMTLLKTSEKFPPKSPWIADRIEFGAMDNVEALGWTADFSRCIAWMCLAPEKIR